MIPESLVSLSHSFISPMMSASGNAHVAVMGLLVPLSWVLALVGGLLIGASASLLLLTTGRIMGASGLVKGVLISSPDSKWRLAFLLAMAAVAALALPLGIPPLAPQSAPDSPCSLWIPATWHSCSSHQQITVASLAAVLLPAVAGFLTGYGSQLGSGCTSGHGVCGLPRLSLRSLVAVGTFMFTGFVTATVTSSFPEASALIVHGSSSWGLTQLLSFAGLAVVLWTLRSSILAKSQTTLATSTEPKALPSEAVTLSAAVAGLIFGTGLLLSGMLDRAKVRGFLNPVYGWDPSLTSVMGGAVLLNLITFPIILRRPQPVCAPAFCVPQRKDVTRDLVLGAAMFGVGWGLYGLCPAPGIMNLVTGRADVAIWNLALACGMLLQHRQQ